MTKGKIVEKWNAAHPVGTSVVVRLDSGKDFATKTRSAAEVLSGHTLVIWLEGIRGCYILERVRPSTPASAPEDV